MKKIYLSFSLIGVFAIFAAFLRFNSGTNADSLLTTTPIVDNSSTSVVQTTPTSEPVNPKTPPAPATKPKPTPVVITPTPPAPTPTPPPVQTGQYRNGTYTGSVADAYYGNIQVQAVISGGKLADVIFLQYPSDRSNSVRINTRAMPILKSQAIAAQSANVDGVSGASASSGAFVQSLGSALTQAVN